MDAEQTAPAETAPVEAKSEVEETKLEVEETKPEVEEATPEVEEAAPVYNFTVSTRDDEQIIEGRLPAVTLAKTLAVDGLAVHVERIDGMVRMQFRDGGLVEYVFETRKGRKA